jgi:LPS O-antigen subunit length determinant protein (WzzB/FepE family)
MENKDNLIGVLVTLFRYKRQILWATLATAVGTALISFLFLDNYYKSTTTFYPVSPDVFKPEQMFGQSTKDMDYYGGEEDVDRLLTIAQSGELYDFLIKKYDLYRHYKIDTTKEQAPYKVREALEGLYSVKKTKFNAIEIAVEDKDRRLAADMTNAARDKVDEIAQRLIREIQANLIRAYETSFTEKDKTLRGIGDTLMQMRNNYGVIDPEKQTEAVTKVSVEAQGNYIRSKARLDALKANPSVSKDTIALLEATLKGYEEESKNNVLVMKKYNEGYNGVSQMKQLYEQERNQIGRDQQRYSQLKVAFQTQIQALKLVESGAIPIVKSRPKRSILVLSATLIALVLSVIGALLIDSYRNVDWSAIQKASANGSSKEHKSSRIGFFKKNT